VLIKKMADKHRPIPTKSNGRRSSTTLSSSSSSSLVNSATLTQQFAEIIRRYKYHCEHIQRILKETKKSYNEINDFGVLTSGMKKLFFHEKIPVSFRKNFSNAIIKI
jgi:hypothetical protein